MGGGGVKLVGAVVVGALIPLGLAWLAGFNFDERGLPALVVAWLSLVGAGIGYGITLDCSDD